MRASNWFWPTVLLVVLGCSDDDGGLVDGGPPDTGSMGDAALDAPMEMDSSEPDTGVEEMDAGADAAADAAVDSGTDASTDAPVDVQPDVPPVDTDMDGVLDPDDNCPDTPNPNQEDLDDDMLGDVCDPDQDGDGIEEDGDGSGMDLDAPCADSETTGCDDNCPFTPNPMQSDVDGDDIGDVCDWVVARSAEGLDNTKGVSQPVCDLQAGEVFVGVAYADYPGGPADQIDGVVSVCASYPDRTVTRRVPNADVGDTSAFDELLCPPGEVPVGIQYRDIPDADNVDGVTVLCAAPTTPDDVTAVANADIDGSDGRPFRLSCPMGTSIAGVGWTDCPGGCDPAESLSILCTCDVEGSAACFADQDGDGILDDGDGSGLVRDAPCSAGDATGCDDNCPFHPNPSQGDEDEDGVGDACDPIRYEDADDALNNTKPWGNLACDFESDEVLLGLAYADTGSGPTEYVDGFVPICAPSWALSEARYVVSGDVASLTTPMEFQCAADEIPVGIAYRDYELNDNIDGATIRCVPAATPSMTPVNVPNADIDGSSASEIVLDCPMGETLVGIAYKDCNGGCDPAVTMGILCLP